MQYILANGCDRLKVIDKGRGKGCVSILTRANGHVEVHHWGYLEGLGLFKTARRFAQCAVEFYGWALIKTEELRA